MLSRICDVLLEQIYGLDPILLRKIHEINALLEPIYGANSLNITIKCLTKLVLQHKNTTNIRNKYIDAHAKQLLAEDLAYRLSLAIKNNNHQSIDEFLANKISLSDIGKASDISKNIVKHYTCISCGGDTIYDAENKKFNCYECYASYADLGI